MVKVKIETLIAILMEAQKNGCNQVKLQLYADWKSVEMEQREPSHPLEDYQVDTRFYNTVEFETQSDTHGKPSDQILTLSEGNTFILRVGLSDWDSLFKNLGIEEFYTN